MKLLKTFYNLFFVIIFLFAFFCTNNLLANDVIMQPYLQAVTQNSITVMIESTKDKAITINYGETEEYGKIASTNFYETTSASPTTYVHRVVLNELQSGKKYYYKVETTNPSITYKGSFHTAVQPGNSFRFAAMGDTRSQVKKHSAAAKGITEHNPKFSLYSGDLCNKPTYESYKSEFLIPNQLELSANVPFINSIGNHEDWSQDTKAFTQAPESNSGEQFYYSFDYGDIHFLVISTEHGLSENSAQVKFAKKDLAESKAKWKIAIFHIPAYCGGGHGENKTMQKFTTNVLEPNDVDVVLTGHSHFYQRNFVNGIYHIVSAGGGAPLYNPKKKDYTQVQAKVHHFMIWDASPDKLAFKVYDIEGKIIDQLDLKK